MRRDSVRACASGRKLFRKLGHLHGSQSALDSPGGFFELPRLGAQSTAIGSSRDWVSTVLASELRCFWSA